MTDKNLAAQIANQIRRKILLGTLPPGASIKERDNATELGVSRTPMREAIRILATEGLVELRPARSPLVALPSIKQVSDDVEVLLAVEKLSGELACSRATEEDIDRIAAIVRDMDQRFDTADPVDIFETDMAFHRAIADASHNTPLAEIHSRFLARLWRARYLAHMKRRERLRVIDQHSDIVSALRARDPKAVRRTIDQHLGNLAEDILREIRQDIDAVSAVSG